MGELTRRPNDARLVVFEGLDGSGKTTQLALLSEKMKQNGLPHLLTREPSNDNPVGRLTREFVDGSAPLENETLALLFAADRFQHVAKVILPALNNGTHVLCDRFYFSNFAYQGDETPFARLAAYNGAVMDGLKPDVTFFLDVDPEECVRRIQARNPAGPGLYENIEKLRRVRARFLEAFAYLKEDVPVAVIETENLSAEEVAEQIWSRWNRLGHEKR